MKTKHFYSFSEEVIKKMKSHKLDMDGWEALRTDNQRGVFSIERTREDYVKSCESREEYREAAEKIKEIVNAHGWNRMISMGVGKGILEYHIKKLIPEMDIECADYTQSSLELLQQVLTECDDFRVFDMMRDDWSSLKEADAIILYRLSTEFTEDQWIEIFGKMYEAGIQYIIYVPTELLDFQILVKERIHNLINIVRGRKNIFCGWMYSEKKQRQFFRGKSQKALYKVENVYKLEHNAVFELKRNE